MNYCQALSLYKEIENTNGMGVCYNNIGNIHIRNQRYEEAIVFYEESVRLINITLKEFNDSSDHSQFSERILLSDENYRQTIKMRADRVTQLAKALLLIVSDKSAETNYILVDKAIKLFNNANETYNEIGGAIGKIINNKIKIVKLFIIKKEIEKAEFLIEDIDNSIKNIGKKDLIRLEIPVCILNQKTLFQKGLIEKMKGNFQKAVEHFSNSLKNGETYDPWTKKKYFILKF